LDWLCEDTLQSEVKSIIAMADEKLFQKGGIKTKILDTFMEYEESETSRLEIVHDEASIDLMVKYIHQLTMAQGTACSKKQE
jgi:hypothetical protein